MSWTCSKHGEVGDYESCLKCHEEQEAYDKDLPYLRSDLVAFLVKGLEEKVGNWDAAEDVAIHLAESLLGSYKIERQ